MSRGADLDTTLSVSISAGSIEDSAVFRSPSLKFERAVSDVYQIRSDGIHLVAMVTIKIQNAGQSIQSGHGARTAAGTLVVSFMAKDKEKEGEKLKKKLQKVVSFVVVGLTLC